MGDLNGLANLFVILGCRPGSTVHLARVHEHREPKNNNSKTTLTRGQNANLINMELDVKLASAAVVLNFLFGVACVLWLLDAVLCSEQFFTYH